MKYIGRIGIILIAAFLFRLNVFSNGWESLSVLIEYTNKTFYADVLIDKELVLGEWPKRSPYDDLPDDIYEDLLILKNFEFDDMKPMQQNTYIKGYRMLGPFQCKNTSKGCLFSTVTRMPEEVQLVLMDKEHNFYVSEPIAQTENNYVKIDFKTMQVTYNRNTILRFITPILWLLFSAEFIAGIIFEKRKQNEFKGDLGNVKLTEFFFFVPYAMSIVFLIERAYKLDLLLVLLLNIFYVMQSKDDERFSLSIALINFSIFIICSNLLPVF